MYLQYYFCAFLIVMKVLVLSDCHVDSNIFDRTCDYFSVCEMLYYRCTHLRYFAHPGFFVILILMYVFIVLVPF